MSTMQIDRLLDTVVKLGASDLHLSVGRQPTIRLHGHLRNLQTKLLDSEDMVGLMKAIKKAGYKVEERAFTLEEAYKAKEVFLTGTTTLVMPVVRIDERVIANGVGGSVALDLRKLYRAYIDDVTKTDAAWVM